MAPQIVSKKGARTAPAPAPAGRDAAPRAGIRRPLMMAQEREVRAKLRELRDHIVKNADNVGERFPNEARKMHYGDIEHRPIYGEASPDEAQLPDRGRRRGLAAAGRCRTIGTDQRIHVMRAACGS